jgi:pimeloyl-ACP methyl ester carboxylesterase
MAFERLGTGCSEKVVRVGDHDISYNDCGDDTGEPVLFVHGFGADKDIWNRLIKDIDCKFHMIAIDLPGWGKSSFISGQDYGVQQNAGRIDSFRTAIGIDSWHVVGWSMGGTTSATYALRYPERVRSVTLMDTGGFRLPAFAEGKPDPIEAAKVLLVKNREDFDRTLEMAFANPPWLPGFARNIAAEHLIARGPAQSEMLPRVMVDITSLSSTFKDYKGALQVIWGQEDRMMDKSVMSTIKDMHPDAVTHIIEGCGHSPLMEKPSESAKLISDFITAIKAKPTH